MPKKRPPRVSKRSPRPSSAATTATDARSAPTRPVEPDGAGEPDELDDEGPTPEELSEQVLQRAGEMEDADLRPDGLEAVDVWPHVDVRAVEARGVPVAEQGLSVEPEDLGRQWLATATEQANFEGSLADELGDELHVVDPDEEVEPDGEDDRQDEELRRASPPGMDPPPRARAPRRG
ncbi:hypothetical protein L6R52_07885 [Myxococcota bacterium]|nr:hypothetical protein [Myxococcota bacterium]